MGVQKIIPNLEKFHQFCLTLISVITIHSVHSLDTALLPPTYFLCLIVNIFLNLVNETFSNFKFNVIINPSSIFSNKYGKQVVLINHS